MEKKAILLLIFILILGIFIIKKLDDNFIESCQKAGYSKEYCEVHK